MGRTTIEYNIWQKTSAEKQKGREPHRNSGGSAYHYSDVCIPCKFYYKASQLKSKADKMDIPFEYQSEGQYQSGKLTVTGDYQTGEKQIKVYICPNNENSEYSYYYYKP